MQLRLMSHNIWNCDKNRPAWEERGEDCSAVSRARGFVRLYCELAPDLVGVQEMTNLMTRELILGLADRGYRLAVLWGNFTPILYRPEKFELIDSLYCVYPEHLEGLEGSFNDVKSKSLLAGVFRIKETGGRLIFATTHLWWKSGNPAYSTYQAGSDEARERQAALAAAQLDALQERYGCPAVLVGDLNTGYESPAVTHLRSVGFAHAHDIAIDYASEEHGYHWCGADGYTPYAPKPFSEAIDHILVRGAPAGFVRRFDRVTPDYYLPLSDHSPVLADVEI